MIWTKVALFFVTWNRASLSNLPVSDSEQVCQSWQPASLQRFLILAEEQP